MLGYQSLQICLRLRLEEGLSWRLFLRLLLLRRLGLICFRRLRLFLNLDILLVEGLKVSFVYLLILIALCVLVTVGRGNDLLISDFLRLILTPPA